MRYVVNSNVLRIWFSDLKNQSGMTWKKLACTVGVTRRTLYEWKLGKSTIPASFVEFVRTRFGVKKLVIRKEVGDFWSRSKSGKLGGLKRNILYGNPGTAFGRRLGGLRSQMTHQNKNLSPFKAREVFLPLFSSELAEFIGIVLGDGGIQKRQVVITLHKEDDKKYSCYVKELVEKLFLFTPSVIGRRDENIINVILSRVAVVRFLQKTGLFIGNKVQHQVDVPEWIKRDKIFRLHCIRGLFDTDGCFYVDRHVIKGKVYINCGMNFTNHSLPLLSFFKQTLLENGYHPTQRTEFSVFLRKEKEILRYFREIGSSNEKVINRFNKYFLDKYGRVPKRS